MRFSVDVSRSDIWIWKPVRVGHLQRDSSGSIATSSPAGSPQARGEALSHVLLASLVPDLRLLHAVRSVQPQMVGETLRFTLIWLWLKIQELGLRRFWSMFPLTRATHFGIPVF